MAFRDVIDFYEESDRNRADVLNEPLEYLLQNDNYLKELAERIQTDLDAVSNSLGTEYTKTEDLNDLLANGVKGDKGDTGVGLEYNWDDTRLGVKREDETDYTYVDLRGPSGSGGLEADEITEMINQAVDGIIVPNKVSQLENDEGFITEDDLPTIPSKVSEIENDLNFFNSDNMVVRYASGTYTLSDFVVFGIYNFTSTCTITDIPVGVNGWLIVIPAAINSTIVKQFWLRQGSITTNSWYTYERLINGTNVGEWKRYAMADELTTLKTNLTELETTVEDLKTTSVNGKNNLTSAINGVLGTSYTSSTSYSELVSAINKIPAPQSYLNCIRYGDIESNTSSSSSHTYSVTNLRMIIVSAGYTIRFSLSKTATIVSVNSIDIDTYTMAGSSASRTVNATYAEAILFTEPFTGNIYVIECDNNEGNNVAFVADAVEKTN